MKKIFTMTVLLSSALLSFAQTNTKITITTGGNPQQGVTPYYSPANVTINVGDTVEWKNIQGSHNVDGRTSSYPTNPESFYSGAPATGWTFTKVFTLPGFYQFKCTQGNHATTQHGSITVNQSISILDFSDFNRVYVYPNPVSHVLYVKLPPELGVHHGTIALFDLTGREVLRTEAYSGMVQELSVEQLPSGAYYLKIFNHGEELTTVKFMKAND